jgi:hypothetical protein
MNVQVFSQLARLIFFLAIIFIENKKTFIMGEKEFCAFALE